METTTSQDEQLQETDLPEETLPETETDDALEEILSPKRSRPEMIMGLITLLAAALLTVMVVLCLPYMNEENEDPESLVRSQHVQQEQYLETEPAAEPHQEETEATVEPTIPPEENPYGKFDFQYNKNNYLFCLRQDSSAGIDVSAYQGNIDWQAVKDSGIEFAIIRLGYRGYGKAGKLVEDEYAKKNLQGAADAGLKVGAYFFSQALNIKEVDEEIEFMLKILGDSHLDMPIVLDWEIPTAEARTANMDARTLTDIQLHFCEAIEAKGYRAMIYFNWYQSEHLYYLSELEEYPFWLAFYQDRMTYPWKVEMWQYTCTGKVPGITGDVDINVFMK